MALPSEVFRFEVELNDVETHVYETLVLRVARHPSETDRFMLCRVIARCLHHAEGVEFSAGGLCKGSEPALVSTDASGQLRLWIDIGAPSAERLLYEIYVKR